MEIGSFYEINPNCIEKAQKSDGKNLRLAQVEKYGKSHTVFTASGRAAIALALQSAVRERPDLRKKCLMPAYMCDSVFFPFENNGWELCFYHIGTDLIAEEEKLRLLMEKEKPGMVFLHAYYGVDTWKSLRPMLKQWQKEGLLIMEDMTQSYYLETDFHADYIVGSLRKWYAVTDGGFVTTNRSLYPENMESDDAFVKKRVGMQTAKWKYLQEMDTLSREAKKEDLQKEKEAYLALNRELEEYLDENKGVAPMSNLAEKMLMDADEKECRKRRNENYRILQEGLKEKKSLVPVFGQDEKEASPLYMPVYMKEREDMLQYLREHHVYVPILWLAGKENEGCLSESEEYIFAHIAAIPMDQRYGKEEMERILAVIEEYEEKQN